jgi:Tol biopolymer transport system component
VERKLGEVGVSHIRYLSQLTWSRDSKWLVTEDKASPHQPFALFLLSVESGEKRQLTFPPAHFLGDLSPNFSPDGAALAFSRWLLISDLYLQRYPGFHPYGEPRRLTSVEDTAAAPSGRT